MEDDDWFGRHDARAERYVFGAVFLAYALTVAPGVAGGDSGELLAEACVLGTAHPPGYPLFTLAMHGVLRLPRVFFASTPAAWANLATAACGAGAAAALVACAREVSYAATGGGARARAGVGGVAAGALFAFSPLTWQYACTAEVFALNNLLVAALLHRALRFAARREPRDLRVGAFLCGLALTNQHTAVLFEVPLVAWMVLLRGDALLADPREAAALVAAGLAGLAPYAYLPLAAPQRGGWGDVRSLGGFLHHLLRRDYGTLRLYSGRATDAEGLAARLDAYYHSLDAVQGPGRHVLPALACVGLVALLLAPPPPPRAAEAAPDGDGDGGAAKKKTAKDRRRSRIHAYHGREFKGAAPRLVAPVGSQPPEVAVRRGTPTAGGLPDIRPPQVGVALAAALAFYLVVFHSMSNLPLHDPLLYGIHARFWMQPHLVVALVAGLGVEAAATALARLRVPRAAAAYPLCLLLVCAQLRAGLRPPGATAGAPGGLYSRALGLSDAPPAWYFHDYARALLAPLPEGALLLINYDQQWTSVR